MKRSVADAVRYVFQPRNRMTTCVGGAIAAYIPWRSFQLLHTALPANATWQGLQEALSTPAALVALGGMVFSGINAFRTMKATFSSNSGGLAAMALLEGSMLIGVPGAAGAVGAYFGLAVLMALDALAAATFLAEHGAATRKEARAAVQNVVALPERKAPVRAARKVGKR